MLKGKKDVIKHSAAIHIQNNITLLQRRAWNVLLANAYDELPNEDITRHGMLVRELMNVLEFESNNMDYLKEALGALVGCKVEWNLLGKAREEWKATTLLAEVGIERLSENGPYICTYAYGPTLRERLYNPRMYARISLSMQNKFESKYAQALWELCTDYLDESRNYGETPFLDIEELKKLIGVAGDGYSGEFKILNRDVIKLSVKEINEVTDFHVRTEYKRRGRKVIGIKFLVSRLLEAPVPMPRQKDLFGDDKDTPVVVRELKRVGLRVEDAWKIWQQGFDYVAPEKRPQNVMFETYILEKIDLVKRRKEAGAVKSATGFLLKAIKQNYSNPEFAEEKKKREVREKTNSKLVTERKRQKLEDQEVALRRSRDDKIHEVCEQIVKEYPEALKEALEIVAKEKSVLRTYLAVDEQALFEAHRTSPIFYILVDTQLRQRFPERFTGVLATYEAELASLKQELSALEQVAA